MSFFSFLVCLLLLCLCNGEYLKGIKGGDGFLEIGDFRIGVYDTDYFSISSNNLQKTSIIFTSNGTYLSGPTTDKGLWNKALIPSGSNVNVSTNGLIFKDDWCIGISIFGHLTITKLVEGMFKQTSMIWRYDGTRHPGPRDDHSCWSPNHSSDVKTGKDKNGRDFIQFGDMFRIGDTGFGHLSIVSEKTIVIYRTDGTVLPGPREDWRWAPFPLCPQ